jgi:chromosome segregation ATPase
MKSTLKFAMEKKSNKKITLEQLADKMDKGFEQVDKKFELVDKRFDKMGVEFNKKIDDKIDGLASAVKTGFDEIYDKLRELDLKISNLKIEIDDRFNEVSDRFREIREEINDIDKRLERIEKSSLEDSDFLADELVSLKKKNKFFEKRLQKLESRVLARA